MAALMTSVMDNVNEGVRVYSELPPDGDPSASAGYQQG